MILKAERLCKRLQFIFPIVDAKSFIHDLHEIAMTSERMPVDPGFPLNQDIINKASSVGSMPSEASQSSPPEMSSSPEGEIAAVAPPLRRPPIAKPKSVWPAMVLAMGVVLAGVGWRIYQKTQAGDGSIDPSVEQPSESRLPVRIAKAKTGLAQDWVFDEGEVWPVQRRVLNFEADGEITYLARINGRDLREGDRVTQGTLLAQIDDRNQAASIVTANADVQVAIEQTEQAKAALNQAKARQRQAEADLALQETELSRYQQLYDQGAVSESDRDVFRNRVIQAQTSLSSTREDIASAANGVRAAEAQVAAAGARLKQSDVALEDTQLISPIDGQVAYINIRKGEYWGPSRLDTSSDQRLIETAPIVVMDPNSFEVLLELQAEQANTVQPGQTAYVILEEEISAAQAAGGSSSALLKLAQERGSAGTVFSVSPSSTPGSRGTRITIRDLVDVDRLRVGARVYAWIEVASNPGAVLVPFTAVVPRGQESYTFVVQDDQTVTRRQIRTGVETANGVEILSGVQAGESVVIEGENRLVEGTPVDIVEVKGAQ